jgi:hypothetical protein
MKFDDRLVGRVDAVHEQLKAVLAREFPDTTVLVLLTALTYEVARLVGKYGETLPPVEVDEMLTKVFEVMREHVRAYRRGLTH